MNLLKKLLLKTKGYKTYIVSIAMILVGMYKSELNLVLEGLALAGLRNGVSTEMANFIVKKKK